MPLPVKKQREENPEAGNAYELQQTDFRLYYY